MKKRVHQIIGYLLSLSLCLTLLPAASAAESPGQMDRWGAAAEALWKDGLFLGSGASFDLDQPLTRAAGVTMVVRLLGKDAEAKGGAFTTPFTDVPDWAAGYVGYAYTNGLTQGTSAATFGSTAPMTAAQYLTLTLRALGYDDKAGDFTWDKAENKALSLGLVQSGDLSGDFLRGQAALISYNALAQNLKGTDKTLKSTITVPGKPSGAMPSYTSQSALPAGVDSLSPALETELQAKIDARRSAILNSPTTVTVTGTSYYVSTGGDDKNDGLSPERPWATMARVNATEFKPGDGVFFRRGDLWRGKMIENYQEGVTYSAYGEGPKPAFYGSPGNGAGGEKWTLADEANHIWVYETELPFCGSIVLNGEQAAVKHWLYWNGKQYTKFGTDDVPFAFSHMKNLTFHNDVDLTDWSMDESHWDSNGNLGVWDCEKVGKLYLRCDEGNPGEVFRSIEFSTGQGVIVGSGCVVDNLCIKYVGNSGVMNGADSLLGLTVQNCEVAFMGDTYLSFEPGSKLGVGGGEGFTFSGYGSTCKNNYVHDGREGSFTVELGWDGTVQAGQQKMGGLEAAGNLFERNNVGIGIIIFLEETPNLELSDILIDDNYFVQIGYKEDLTGSIPWGDCCIWVTFAGSGDQLRNMRVSNNLFYLAYPKLVNLYRVGEADIRFEGNTYVQGLYQQVLSYAKTFDTQQEFYVRDPGVFEYAVTQILGDRTGKIYIYDRGLKEAEIDRARTLGLVPPSAPKDLNTQITSAQMTDILTRLVSLVDKNVLPAWQTISKTAGAADAKLLRCDGMVAVYEAAVALGLEFSDRDNPNWRIFEELSDGKDLWDETAALNQTLYPDMFRQGVDPEYPDWALHNLALLYSFERYSDASNAPIFDYDAVQKTMHGGEVLTWDKAIKAAVRLYDSMNIENYRHYLVP